MRHPQYNEGHLKSVFILARNVQHIILKSKSTKAPLMSVLYNHRNHEVSSNVSQRFTFLWERRKNWHEWRLCTFDFNIYDVMNILYNNKFMCIRFQAPLVVLWTPIICMKWKCSFILEYFLWKRKPLTQIWRNSMISMIVKDWHEGHFYTFSLQYDVLNILWNYKCMWI